MKFDTTFYRYFATLLTLIVGALYSTATFAAERPNLLFISLINHHVQSNPAYENCCHQPR